MGNQNPIIDLFCEITSGIEIINCNEIRGNTSNNEGAGRRSTQKRGEHTNDYEHRKGLQGRRSTQKRGEHTR